ncbi:hypothetical protein N7U66_03300 [Lacinutrix neustonica]|uniref:Uncharacterized protein n=1 Tax=Lacinutrix neustonica TaxID=2980107 RepID=A0A9E8MXH9_9FLAO|nr:hypothetical protein [Lacinutrix neustonica]WAC02710.1 hypothetical protein N7U66_03300 [Lacinutrix neustonica]
MELVIGLAISSIVISMVYIIYTNISKQIVEYSKQQSELMEYNQFQNIWSADIRLCNELMPVDPKRVKLLMAQEDIQYFFANGHVIRQGKTRDTFNINVKELELNAKESIDEHYQVIRLKTTLLGQDIIVFEEKKITLAKRLNNYLLGEY